MAELAFVGDGPVVAHIDTAALRHNARRLREAAGGVGLWAVVKADAYGHGMGICARALAGGVVDGFAVARTGEGVALRRLGIDEPVLVMGGPVDAAEFEVYREHRLQGVIHHVEQLEGLTGGDPLTVWLKVDSGMTRLGLMVQDIPGAYARACRTPGVTVAGFMTHFANADDVTDDYTQTQCETFHTAIHGLPGQRMLSNSAAILGWPAARADAVRAGLALYGISPFAERCGESEGLRPVMTLTTRLLSCKRVRAGTPVGYGGSWRCPEDMPVGVAAIGYADGFARDTPAGTPVVVDGTRARTVSPVSMDLLGLDLRACPDVSPGATVTLWGPALPVEEVARAIGRIPYELVAGLGSRVVRVVSGGEEDWG